MLNSSVYCIAVSSRETWYSPLSGHWYRVNSLYEMGISYAVALYDAESNTISLAFIPDFLRAFPFVAYCSGRKWFYGYSPLQSRHFHLKICIVFIQLLSFVCTLALESWQKSTPSYKFYYRQKIILWTSSRFQTNVVGAFLGRIFGHYPSSWYHRL